MFIYVLENPARPAGVELCYDRAWAVLSVKRGWAKLKACMLCPEGWAKLARQSKAAALERVRQQESWES